MVLAPEGAVAVRKAHRPSEDRKWCSESMSRAKGAPRDREATAGEDINDGGTPETN